MPAQAVMRTNSNPYRKYKQNFVGKLLLNFLLQTSKFCLYFSGSCISIKIALYFLTNFHLYQRKPEYTQIEKTQNFGRGRQLIISFETFNSNVLNAKWESNPLTVSQS
jgi:hypothetical protein